MPTHLPAVARAIAAVQSHVLTTYAPLGILMSGSLIRGEGEADPRSDLDVFVIHEHPWRRREQRRFEGIPVEIFVNPPDQVRRYFATGHRAGRPDTAHMFATGEPLEPVHDDLRRLIAEAREWLARPLEPTPEELAQLRYAAVDVLDDARDTIARDPTAAALLLAETVRHIVAYAFWKERRFQPRRKDAAAALAAIDPHAAELLLRWAATPAVGALAIVEELARQVLDVDTFFEWASAPDATPAS